VYCPYSCKKIKIGLSKDKKIEALEFNTTTNRTVSFYANENIRYLVNKHRPNKKDKKTITGDGWSCSVEVEDKGNIAIFNPYCVDPLQPLTFFVILYLYRLLEKYSPLLCLLLAMYTPLKNKEIL
jgi:hypothetical protein